MTDHLSGWSLTFGPLYIAADAVEDGDETAGGEWKVLADLRDQLDQVARSRGAPALGDFVGFTGSDADELCRFLGADPAEVRLPPERWFRLTDGLRAAQWLLTELRREPSVVPRSAEVVSALEELADELATEEDNNILFRFCICPVP